MARILLVEDSPAMRGYIRSALEGLGGGSEIVEAASGPDALRLLPRNTYNLVIIDTNLPNFNGLELIRFVRQSSHLHGVAILAISTCSSERDRAGAMALGADAYLVKPFTPELLRSTVAPILNC